jgi:phosphate acetyltransferase
MTKAFYISPTGIHSGLSSISLGLVRALDKIGVRVGFYKPVTENESGNDNSIYFANKLGHQVKKAPIHSQEAERLLGNGDEALLMERVVSDFNACTEGQDIVIVEGLVPTANQAYGSQLNKDIARNLNAQIILVCSEDNIENSSFNEELKVAASLYSSSKDPDVIGAILNKIRLTDAALNRATEAPESFLTHYEDEHTYSSSVFSDAFKLIGSIPWQPELSAPRVIDLAKSMPLEILKMGDAQTRRVQDIVIAAQMIDNIIPRLVPGALVVTPADRSDVIIATCMASLSGTPLAALMLTGNSTLSKRVGALCDRAFIDGLPLLKTELDTFQSASALSSLNIEVQEDDFARMERMVDTVSEFIDLQWLKSLCARERKARLSPPAFRNLLAVRARRAAKRIVLPEGNEPRTVSAATICQQRGFADCVLIGKRAEIEAVAHAQGFELHKDITIVDPDTVRENYVAPMVELRKHKGLAPDMALAQLEDNVVLATMMVALNEVDGLVSGAVHTTANTVRPALQLIKTADHAKVVSSVFFMCLPEQVLVYGDCAINPDPSATQLADIAIQSADSALAFGIKPKVAMISYSTGASGSGSDVEKVREATKIAQALRPDLEIDGPLQYDAAAIKSVAAKKAPDSKVAGEATVFIFPDLNTGNTTYKAVQRSANVISMGPMLQGLRKPVNDLSRGALVDDIVYTIALTAIQAKQVADQT